MQPFNQSASSKNGKAGATKRWLKYKQKQERKKENENWRTDKKRFEDYTNNYVYYDTFSTADKLALMDEYNKLRNVFQEEIAKTDNEIKQIAYLDIINLCIKRVYHKEIK